MHCHTFFTEAITVDFIVSLFWQITSSLNLFSIHNDLKQFVFADESCGGHSENEVYEHLENIEQVNNVDVVISKKG